MFCWKYSECVFSKKKKIRVKTQHSFELFKVSSKLAIFNKSQQLHPWTRFYILEKKSALMVHKKILSSCSFLIWSHSLISASDTYNRWKVLGKNKEIFLKNWTWRKVFVTRNIEKYLIYYAYLKWTISTVERKIRIYKIWYSVVEGSISAEKMQMVFHIQKVGRNILLKEHNEKVFRL